MTSAQPFLLDIIIIVFILLMVYLGYRKGFIVRLYDFLTTILSIFIAYAIYQPVSKVIVLYRLEPPLTLFGEIINSMIIFVCVFMLFKLTCKILGIFLKPVLQKIVSFLKVTEMADHILAVILSFVESIILVYIVLFMVIVPFFHQKEFVDSSLIGSMIEDIVPDFGQKVIQSDVASQLSTIDINTKDATTVTLISDVLYQVYQHDMIDTQSLKIFMETYYGDIEDVSINQKTYDSIMEMADHTLLDKQLLNGIKVSDENEE